MYSDYTNVLICWTIDRADPIVTDGKSRGQRNLSVATHLRNRSCIFAQQRGKYQRGIIYSWAIFLFLQCAFVRLLLLISRQNFPLTISLVVFLNYFKFLLRFVAGRSAGREKVFLIQGIQQWVRERFTFRCRIKQKNKKKAWISPLTEGVYFAVTNRAKNNTTTFTFWSSRKRRKARPNRNTIRTSTGKWSIQPRKWFKQITPLIAC